MSSVEKLTDVAVEQGGAVPASALRGPGSVERVDRSVCEAMVAKAWRGMLAGVSQLLARVSGEEAALALLRGYQAFCQACGVLGLVEPRDAFLGSLCEFALASAREQMAEAEAGSGVAGAAGRPASTAAGPSGLVSPGRTGGAGADEGGLVLAPKNVQAMRTLFNIAHRLSSVLGPAWALVLETMNTLDRLLDSPAATTKVFDIVWEEAGLLKLCNPAAAAAVALAPAVLQRHDSPQNKCTAQEVSDTASGAGVSSDLAILSAAASQMFECSRDMGREAVVALLSGLRDVSMRNLPSVGVVQPRLFALNRMVEVLLYNFHRIFDLWAIFLRWRSAGGCGRTAWVVANACHFILLLPLVTCPELLCHGPKPSVTLQPCAGAGERPAPRCTRGRCRLAGPSHQRRAGLPGRRTATAGGNQHRGYEQRRGGAAAHAGRAQ